MEDREEQEEITRVRLGNEARAFYNSLLGKYLVNKADDMIEQKTVELIQCSPTDGNKNLILRSQIEIGVKFKQWLDEAIVDGANTELQLRAEEVQARDNANY